MPADYRRRTILAVSGVVLAGLTYVLFLVVLPGELIDAGDFARGDGSQDAAAEEKARNDLRSSTVQLIGLLAVISGAVFTGRTYYVNRQGQITDRFTKAIGQLGDTAATDVRLGGIYSLERIARESEYDHGPITEVLSAFVRERRTARGASPVERVPADIQAAITVLGRRRLDQEVDGPTRLNLRGIQTRGVDLRGDKERRSGRFDRADFSGAALEGVDLSYASLDGATMNHTHLEGAHFYWTSLDRCFLERANLQGARFIGGSLSSANFSYAACERIWVSGAEGGPSGYRTSLEGARFLDTNLTEAFLEGAQLQGAFMKNVNLTGAKLGGAQLWGATLLRVDFSDADLEGTDLRGVRAVEAIWPSGFDPAAAGLGQEWHGSADDYRGINRSHETITGLIHTEVDLRGASFDNATLEAPNLEGVNARGATFAYARITGGLMGRADLRGADLESVKFVGVAMGAADLRGSNLRRAAMDVSLESVQLAGAQYDSATVWPEAFDPQAAGAIPRD